MSIRSYLKFKLMALILAFVCVLFAFSLLVIKNFSLPLTGWAGFGPDQLIGYDYIDFWEYMGFYFAKNLKLLPIPQLNLVNNQVFYPYGVNSVFQAWGIERDIFYAILYLFFGVGPWLQFYYLLTIIITALGSFFLLVRDYGVFRASGAGFIVAFFNFYAIHKYPHHLLVAVVHWTTLSFIADFLIVKRVVLRRHVSLRLILVRACLLILSLGQDLGYVAGFALMSFTVSALFIAVLLGYRYFQRKLGLTELFQRAVANYKSELFTYPRTSLVLVGLSIIAGYIYLPLAFQIAKEAKSFDFTGIPTPSGWASPFRLLIPWLPIINPGLALDQVFLDSTEGLGTSSPGWFLLILGSLGLWQSRRQITIFIPLLIIFILCLLYNPLFFPTLKIFPWFAFNRGGGRSTVIYPVILCLFALQINFYWLKRRSRQLLSALLVFLACTELYTAYSFKLDYQPYLLDQNFFTYMDYVKKQPGEAVLDWPFCVWGGNWIGFCPYFRYNNGIHAMRRFHEKKVMGQYFGRLHPDQIEPYLQAGWDKLFFPDSPDIYKATRQARCFRPAEWSFFTDFYKLNDFAGINLYVELLPENCISEFYARFGTPERETLVPGAGRVKFIPKSPDFRNQVNLALGASLKFEPLLDLSESNLLQVSSPYGLTITGLEEIEKSEQIGNLRWGLEPETVLSFRLSEPQTLELSFSFDNPIPGQDVAVEINQVTVETIANIKAGENIERHLKFQGVRGLNNISFKSKKIPSYLDLFKNLIKSQGVAGINHNNLWSIYGRYFSKTQKVIKFRNLAISA